LTVFFCIEPENSDLKLRSGDCQSQVREVAAKMNTEKKTALFMAFYLIDVSLLNPIVYMARLAETDQCSRV